MTTPTVSPALALLAALAGGCVSTTTVPLGTESYPPRAEGHAVAVYDSLDDLPEAWVKVARIRAHDDLFGDVLGVLRSEARRLGGDALVLIHEVPCYNQCGDRDDWSVLVVRWK